MLSEAPDNPNYQGSIGEQLDFRLPRTAIVSHEKANPHFSHTAQQPRIQFVEAPDSRSTTNCEKPCRRDWLEVSPEKQS